MQFLKKLITQLEKMAKEPNFVPTFGHDLGPKLFLYVLFTSSYYSLVTDQWTDQRE